MQTVIDRIQSAGKDEIAEILRAGVARYQQLYPDWQMSMITLQKAEDKNAQLDRMITLLQNLKEK